MVSSKEKTQPQIMLKSELPGHLIRHATLRQLQVFEATVRLGSFTQAAEELFLTQPTVSIQIKKLADAVGMPLFEHIGRKVFPTEAGLIPWNVEYVILVDDARGLELMGRAQGPARQVHRTVADRPAMLTFAEEVGFPDHHLVLRPDNDSDPRIVKGISDVDTLERTFARALEQSAMKRVFVETDLRAHCNPTRMQMVARATEDLLARLGSLCPACEAPGFWLVERIPGLHCADCGAPTREAHAEVYGCIQCPYRETRPMDPGQYADPAVCDWCNP
jgi:hypothetical protein